MGVIGDLGLPLESGIASVEDFAALAALSLPVGTQVYVESEAGTRTLCAVGAFSLWLRDAWVRKTDGTLYTRAIAQASTGEDLHLYAGMSDTISGWPKIGTYDLSNPAYVELNGAVYPNSASTAERVYLYAEMYSAPPAGDPSAAFCGFTVGTFRGGSPAYMGIKFSDTTSPYGLHLGVFGSSVAYGGSSESALGRPVEMLMDLSSADALTQGMGDGRGPGLVIKRSSLDTGQRYAEAGALDSGVGPVSGFRIKRAIWIDLT